MTKVCRCSFDFKPFSRKYEENNDKYCNSIDSIWFCSAYIKLNVENVSKYPFTQFNFPPRNGGERDSQEILLQKRFNIHINSENLIKFTENADSYKLRSTEFRRLHHRCREGCTERGREIIQFPNKYQIYSIEHYNTSFPIIWMNLHGYSIPFK